MSPKVSPLDKEDRWAWVNLGDPFPENPVRVKGETNMYVALWYKHGKPVFGRAWNDGGVLQCSFPYNKHELTGKVDLGGKIQVLTNEGDFSSNGYWYDWVRFKDRKQDHLKHVFCGECSPIYTKSKAGDTLLGNIHNPTETASVSYEGRADVFVGGVIFDMLIPCKNIKNPLGDEKPKVEPEEGLGQMVVELGGEFGQDLWYDVRVGDKLPTHAILAGGRQLNFDGTGLVNHMVALWYQHGIPVMGRAWVENGRVKAAFGWNGHEYTDCGSFQILRHHNSKSHGFEYTWLPYEKLHPTNKNDEGWEKVHVKNISPCVVFTEDRFERLGKINMKDEIAGYPYQGKEHQINGPKCKPYLVLARRDVATK